MDRIDSYDRRKKSEINLMFMQADLIANRVAKCFDPQKVKTVMPWDCFPEVFEKERKEYEQQEVITVKIKDVLQWMNIIAGGTCRQEVRMNE